MSIAIGAQGIDLSQSFLFQGYDPSILEREGYYAEPSLNYPWLIAISSQMGNAYTAALSRTAHVFSEIESWEGVGGGGNQANWNTPMRQAMGHGMMSIWW